jgi:Mor family transcriptional regulator
MSGAFHYALPQQLREMAQAVGISAVMTLVRWRGGVQFYVPQKVSAEHELVRKLGKRAAEWLVKNLGGDYLLVPRAVAMLRAQRDAEIVKRLNAGETAKELALEHGLHERQIWKIRADGVRRRNGTT